MRPSRLALVGCVLLACAAGADGADPADWTRGARIVGNGLEREHIPDIIREAQDAHAQGIEVDNDITGRYESLLDPAAKLEDLRLMAQAAHAAGLHTFVYIAGLECITGNAEKREHTLLQDHPDWVQRDRQGRPAVFGGGTAFWIEPGDEDVWVTPFAVAWRTLYMERVRQIAATGVDGIYVDIPYWMTHFDGWEDRWPSFDAATVAEFRRRTGRDALTGVKLGEADDPGFRSWVEFRIDAITEFMAEIARTAKAVNPACLTIAEIYPGYDDGAIRTGADVYRLCPVVDVIAHEFDGGEGIAALKSPRDWARFSAGMDAFRAFAGDRPTWMLAYSWDGQKEVPPREAMLTLACAEVMAGASDWDPHGHVMDGTNDAPARTEIFAWIEAHREVFYAPRVPLAPVEIRFDPAARNRNPGVYAESFTREIVKCLRGHRAFQVVTPRSPFTPGTGPGVEVQAPPTVLARIALVNGHPHAFLFNTAGLEAGKRLDPLPVRRVGVAFPAGRASRVMCLPFMGEVRQLMGVVARGRLRAELPPIGRGMVVWCE